MRNRIAIFVLLLAAAGAGEIIDRIAVSLDHQVITESDLLREIRVMAFLAGRAPDFSPAGLRQTAERMVEQRLVRREMQMTRYPAPDPAEVEPVLQKFRQENYPGPGSYERALAAAAVTDQEVRDETLWQLTLARFIGVRFRPGVQVSDEEVRAYFEKTVKAAAPGASTPSLDDEWDDIEEAIVQQKIDREMAAWMEEARKRTGVEYRPEVFGE